MPCHSVSNHYVMAAANAAGCLPVLIPAIGDCFEVDAVLDHLDGLMLSGSPSNVEPHNYDGPPSREGTWHDSRRDATTLPLIRAAIARGVPLLGVCLGHQELNVALGGSLHQLIHELPGHLDHRSPREIAPRERKVAPAHGVRLTPGGVLARLAGGATEIEVNSLHNQGIDRLAPGLFVEAVAPDGIIEAVRVKDAPAFAFGVQWHPEGMIGSCHVARGLFALFSDAARARAHRRNGALAAA